MFDCVLRLTKNILGDASSVSSPIEYFTIDGSIENSQIVESAINIQESTDGASNNNDALLVDVSKEVDGEILGSDSDMDKKSESEQVYTCFLKVEESDIEPENNLLKFEEHGGKVESELEKSTTIKERVKKVPVESLMSEYFSDVEPAKTSPITRSSEKTIDDGKRQWIEFNFDPVTGSESSGNTNRRIHKCCYCAKEFPLVKVYHEHLKTEHDVKANKYKKYSLGACGVCGKLFKCRENLKLHLSIHNEDLPFGCSTCSAAFKSSKYKFLCHLTRSMS